MRNLAGDEQCDASIRDELTAAGIDVVTLPERRRGEVATILEGKLGPFKFERAWYYWMVSGPVPIAAARETYDDQVGRLDVRVDGYAGNTDPGRRNTVNSYHIDTSAGLKLFVETIKKYGLAK